MRVWVWWVLYVVIGMHCHGVGVVAMGGWLMGSSHCRWSGGVGWWIGYV